MKIYFDNSNFVVLDGLPMIFPSIALIERKPLIKLQQRKYSSSDFVGSMGFQNHLSISRKFFLDPVNTYIRKNDFSYSFKYR